MLDDICLESIVNALPDPIVIIDAEMSLLFTNDMFNSAYIDANTAETVFKLTSIFSEAYTIEFENLVTALLANPSESFEMELQLPNKSGELEWINLKLKRFNYSETSKPLVLVSFSVITKYKRVELMAREYSTKLEQAEGRAGLASWEFDALTGLGWWSPQMYKQMNFEGRTSIPEFDEYYTHIHPEDRAEVIDSMGKMAQMQKPRTCVFRTNPEFGTLRYLAPSYYIEHDSDNRIIRFIGWNLDVTERHRYELSLRESEHKFRSILESVPDGILTIDSAGIINLINSQTEKIFGYSKEEIIGKNIEILIPPKYRDIYCEYHEKYFNSTESTDTKISREFDAVHKDGLLVSVEITLNVLPKETEPIGILSIRDISERKAIEKRMRLQSNMLDKVAQAIIVTDMNGNIQYWSKFAESLYGWQKKKY